MNEVPSMVTALHLTGYIYSSFSTAHSSQLFGTLSNISMSLLSIIVPYIIQSCANSCVFHSLFLQISLT